MDGFSLGDLTEILKDSGTGIWKLESENGKPARLFGDSVMNRLIGIADEMSPEECLRFFLQRVRQDDISVLLEQGQALREESQAEAVYRYQHPLLGEIYMRSGGRWDDSVKDCFCYKGFLQNINASMRMELELDEALLQAKQADRAKTVFLNNMSHDIRTPMNAIIGFTVLAERSVDDKEKCREYLSKINTSSQHLLALINDVLDMSRIESGKMKIIETECSLTEIMNELRIILQPDADRKKVQFKVDMEQIVNDRIYCDKLRLNQILLNCASNAIKFTNEGGSVEVRAYQKNCTPREYGCYCFEITDTGIGMSDDFLKTLYSPFSREEKSYVHNIPGTGLGMAITKNLVDMMKGTIEVESQPEKGSRFTITLTFELLEKSESPVAETEEMKEPDLTDKRILLVEDNEPNREIAMDILEETGAVIEEAKDGAQALQMIGASPVGYYDLVLMDIQMPVMNGYEATRAIRKLEREDAEKIIIIAMTANTFEEDKQRAREAGMNDHIAKPLSIPILMETLVKFLK